MYPLEVMPERQDARRHQPSRISDSNARRNLLAYGRFGLDLELALSGGGNYHDRAKARSKPTQEPRENVAVPFQSIGSRASPVSTLSVRPMTSLAPLAPVR